MNSVVKLKPAVKSYIWGGNYFQPYKGLKEDVISELWELSVRDDFSSIVDSGEDKGKRLVDVITKKDVGPISERFPYFPLLIKLIDAKENLSVQVHPSDEYALKNEHSFGKTEMWYVIDADKGSGLYVGFNKDYSREEIEVALKDSTILNYLNFFEVKPGDCYLIKSGTVHAIGKGVRVIEIQQNSNLTYRLYDYIRKDKDGNYRELHIDKALNVIDYKKYEKSQKNGKNLAKTPYFTVNKEVFDGEITIASDGDSFVSFTFLDGEGMVDSLPYKKFDTFFLPHGKKCVVKGRGTVIISLV